MKKLFSAFIVASIFLIAACHNASSSTSEETKEESLINTPQSEHVNKGSHEKAKEGTEHSRTDTTTAHTPEHK